MELTDGHYSTPPNLLVLHCRCSTDANDDACGGDMAVAGFGGRGKMWVKEEEEDGY